MSLLPGTVHTGTSTYLVRYSSNNNDQQKQKQKQQLQKLDWTHYSLSHSIQQLQVLNNNHKNNDRDMIRAIR